MFILADWSNKEIGIFVSLLFLLALALACCSHELKLHSQYLRQHAYQVNTEIIDYHLMQPEAQEFATYRILPA